MKIYQFDCISSTNEYAKKLVNEKTANHFDVVLANEQTVGRGRSGNSFVSPSGGLYFSICLEKNQMPLLFSPVFTIGVALCDVLEEMYDEIKAEIKWVNDIIVDSEKVCGVLAETAENSDFVILGVGINANTKHLDLLGIENVDSLYNITHKEVDLEKLLNEILSKLKKMLILSPSEVMALYRTKCRTIGRDVRFQIDGEDMFGMAVDVADSGELMVITDKGETMLLDSGVVSVRGKDGYI